MIRLGPYELHTSIGEGGMGQVWRARDRLLEREVAVKLITGDGAAQPEYRQRFRAEVQSMARLDHPGIVEVFDYDALEADVASKLGSPVGAPYYVMGLADGTLLSSPPEDWQGVRAMLEAVLDALAHSHSRGVIHRDLKPGNILMDDGHYKLADFGIAYHSHHWPKDLKFEREGDGQMVGSPYYMAPEQWLGHWRDYGPWTDLYALGCLTFELICNRRPFDGTSVMALAVAHTGEVRPKFDPQIAAPDGLEQWFDWILARDPRRRFRRAADAAWALSQLPAVEGQKSKPLAGFAFDLRTEMLPTKTALLSELVALDTNAAAATETAPAVPGVSTEWRTPPRRRSHVRGLGLLGLRAPNMVDREPERDLLWRALREAATSGRPKGVVLEGPAGFGKSRLAQWLCQRAEELGGAKSLRVAHAPGGQFADGITPTLDTAFSTHGLHGDELRERVERALRAMAPSNAVADVLAADTDLVAELIRPSDASVELTRAQRDITLTRLMKALGSQRALVFWVDDAQWAHDTLSLVDELLRHDRRLPILVVMTLRSGPTSAMIAETMNRILALDNVEQLAIGPLPALDQRALVDDLIPLSETLAQSVASQTRGEPLFAVQTVQSWAESAALVRHADHYELRADCALPADVMAACAARVDYLFASFDDQQEPVRAALEYAAALGEHIDEEEWNALCREQGIAVGPQLLERMLLMGIATPHEGAWSFTHHTFRDVIDARTTTDRRLRVHVHWATFLDEHNERTQYGIPGRVAEHWLAARQPAEALQPLLEAAAQHYSRAEYLEALELLENRHTALNELEVPPDDRRQVENRVLTVWYSLNRGEVLHDQMAGLADGERFATEQGWAGLAARQAHLQGYLALIESREDVADDHFVRAIRLSDAGDEHALAGHARRLRGFLAMRAGEFERATELVESALEVFQKMGHAAGIAESRRTIATVAAQRGEPAIAEEQLRLGLRELAGTGLRDQRALLLNDLGELECRLGRYDQAQQTLAEARLLFQHCGMEMFLPEGNLGILLIEGGRPDLARPLLTNAVSGAQDAGHPVQALMFEIALDAAALMVDQAVPPGTAERVARVLAIDAYDYSAGWGLRLLRAAAEAHGFDDLVNAANDALEVVEQRGS